MEDFTESPSLKIHGSIGSKIAKELNLNLSGSDTMSMTIKLGDIIKNEVSILLPVIFISYTHCDLRKILLLKVHFVILYRCNTQTHDFCVLANFSLYFFSYYISFFFNYSYILFNNF